MQIFFISGVKQAHRSENPSRLFIFSSPAVSITTARASIFNHLLSSFFHQISLLYCCTLSPRTFTTFILAATFYVYVLHTRVPNFSTSFWQDGLARRFVNPSVIKLETKETQLATIAREQHRIKRKQKSCRRKKKKIRWPKLWPAQKSVATSIWENGLKSRIFYPRTARSRVFRSRYRFENWIIRNRRIWLVSIDWIKRLPTISTAFVTEMFR